jgi:hypothetical protein
MKPVKRVQAAAYNELLADVAHVIEEARRAAARTVNAVMTTTYWHVGSRIVEQLRGSLATRGPELSAQAARLRNRTGRLFKPRRMIMELLRSSWSGGSASSIDSTLFTICLIAHFISWRASNAPRQW